MRELLTIEGAPYAVVERAGGRLVCEALRGDFSDVRRVLGIEQKEMAARIGVSASYLCRFDREDVFFVPAGLLARVFAVWPELESLGLPLFGRTKDCTDSIGMCQMLPASVGLSSASLNRPSLAHSTTV
jgi:hypothetical protein